MIGQKYLVSTFNRYIDEHTLPRTVLFEGDFGCGKHTLVNEIARKIKYDLDDMTDNITLEKMEEIQLSPYPKVYLINCDDITVKEQNMILKFLEEPLKNSYIFLITTSKQKLLQTVVNRCQCFTFDCYSNEELSNFVTNETSEYVVKYGTTPGWIKLLSDSKIEDIVTLCDKIFLKINIANYSNVLTIPEKICLTKDDADKIDFRIFTYLLINICKDMYIENKISFNTYRLTSRFYNNTLIPNINKKHLLENYLVDLKSSVEEGM